MIRVSARIRGRGAPEPALAASVSRSVIVRLCRHADQRPGPSPAASAGLGLGSGSGVHGRHAGVMCVLCVQGVCVGVCVYKGAVCAAALQNKEVEQ